MVTFMSPVGGGGLRQCGGCGLLTGNLQTALLPAPATTALLLPPGPAPGTPAPHSPSDQRSDPHVLWPHSLHALSNHPGHQPPMGSWCIIWSSVYKSTIDNFASIKLSSGQFSFHTSWVALFWIPCVAPALVVSDMSGWGAAVQGRAQAPWHRTLSTQGAHCTLQHSARCISLISPVMEQKCLKSSNFCPPHTKTRQLQWRLLVKFPSFLVTGGRKLSSSIYQSMPLSGHNCHTLYGPWWILI